MNEDHNNDDRRRCALHAAVFAALSNPTRHELMHLLCKGPRTPSELADLLEVSRPNVSQHLALLRREGLIKRSRQGAHVLWESGETVKVLNVALPAVGIKFTAMSDSWGLGETDLTPIANKIAAKAKEVNPDAIVLCSNPVHINIITKTLRSLGVKAPIYNEGAGSHPLPVLAPAGNDPANVAGDYAIGPAIVDPSKIPDSGQRPHR